MSVTNPRVDNRTKWSVPVGNDRNVGSMAGDLTSDWILCQEQTSSHQLAWTGTAVGPFYVEMSMDGTNVDATITSGDLGSPAAAGADGRLIITIKSPIPYRRIVFDRSSGTGSLTGISRTVRA